MDAARRVLDDGAVAIKGSTIVAVGARAEISRAYLARETIDARGGLIIPGLINAHTHIPMTLFRGLADDLDLNEWLTKFIFPAEAASVTEDFVRVGTRLGLAEMIRGGTTTFCDMYYFEDAIADETARAGVRAVLGETVIDFPVPDNKTPADALRYTEKFIAKYRNHALIIPAVAPHAPYTVAPEILRAAHALSVRTGAPFVIHIAETEKEVADVESARGKRPVAYLASLGVLDERTIAAHLVFPMRRKSVS
jgi:5-methylthioadenosine/S-adenosylhomocysteine deaminase